MGQADISSKYVLAGDPTEWIRWLLQDPTVEVKEHLSGEFQFILRHSDALFRVRGGQGDFVMVAEVQLHPDARMPRRMRAYTALAEEKYDLPAYPVVLYLLPPGKGMTLSTAYHSEFMSLTAHQDFRVVPIWEVNVQQVLEEEIVALTPFVPLMKGADEKAIRAGVKLLRKRRIGEEAEAALALFASFVMEPKRVRKIVRWDMAVLRESPWYNQILQEGRQEGHREGHREGRREGRLNGQRQDIVRLLKARFDPASPHIIAIIEQLTTIDDTERLQDLLVEAMYTIDLEAFWTHLDGKLAI